MRAFVLISAFSLGLPALAVAAQPGTYRPGQAYQSITASSPGQCAAQCQGDAQCKGWNFVKTQRMQASGVCEFNALRVSPVPSPISISGDNETTRPVSSASIIPAGSRTVRVGQAQAPAPQMSAPKAAAARSAPQARRRVVRQAVPAQTKRPQTLRARAARTPNMQTPQVQKQRAIPASARRALLNAQSQVPPQRQIQRQVPRQAQRQIQRQIQGPAPQNAPRPLFQHSLEGGPYAQQQPQRQTPRAAQMAQRQAPAALQAQPQVRPAPPQTPAPPMTTEGIAPLLMPNMPPQPAALVQQSLFGSLHDDVRQPKSLTAADIPLDPDAPIPTVSSIPTQKVNVSPLPDMAGPPVR